MSSWDELLEKLGIAKRFYDAAQNHKEYVADDATLLKMVNYLGFPLRRIEDSAILLQKLNNRRWQYALEPIYVVRQNAVRVDVVVAAAAGDDLQLCLNCGEQILAVEYRQSIIEEKNIGHTLYRRWQIEIVTPLAPQYYTLEVSTAKHSWQTVVAVTPDKCYISPALSQRKLWGFAIQLYSLRSARNWGVGDFTDLQNLARLAARYGADVIGVNPLNVLFHDFPENASPYSSISRLFLNPIYIDVEKVAGYRPEMLHGKQEILQQLRQSPDIDYTGVYNLKIAILRQIFAQMHTAKNSKEYRKFAAFCRTQGADLHQLATYQAIYSRYCHQVYGGWQAWPAELRNAGSPAVQKFAVQAAEDVEFFKYLQYVAFEQLQDTAAVIKEVGMTIGLYRDLPVGLCKDSLELWASGDLFIKDCGAGAPPDIFFPSGQKWCLGAFNPYVLQANRYLPFIKILRAAMDKAGALRIDHVMSLMRLYIIPDNAEEGTYIYYNFDDMLGLVALESHLNHCMIVGESIGNVPDGFVEKLHDRGVYSLSVLWAERWGDGTFKSPHDFPRTAFCSVGTHDMAPLKMRWFGYDIELMYKLKMLDASERTNQYKGRENERLQLLRALDAAGVWPEDKPRQGDCLYGEGYPQGIMEAVERFVSSGNCDVYLAQLEDIFGVTVLQNLPGTDRDKHPNWRRKLPINLEDYTANDDFIRAMAALKR